MCVAARHGLQERWISAPSVIGLALKNEPHLNPTPFQLVRNEACDLHLCAVCNFRRLRKQSCEAQR
jgi:hypothetical protein